MACANSAHTPASGQSVRFAQVELPILADPRLSPTDLRILSLLLAHRNAKSGKAWPKRQTIADKAHVHPETVTKSTAKLVECGYLVKTKGQGRGHITVYTFPLADQRQAQRKAAQAQAAPKAKPEPKPRAEQKPSRPAGFCAAPLIGTDFRETKDLPQTPPTSDVIAEPEAPCGESLATHSPDLGALSAGLADSASNPAPQEAETSGNQQVSSHPATIPSNQTSEPARQTAPQRRQAAKPAKPAPSHRLAFPEGLPALLCVQLGRMLASTPEAIAQEMLDEMAFNARCHVINSPGGYVRRLLNLHHRGEFSPEVAYFERARREHIAANERARIFAERRHLEALAQGQLPPAPPLAMNRSDEDEAQAEQALAQAKLAARGALLSPEQREQARFAYLASKPAAPTPALATHQGEEDPQALEFFASIKASLGMQSGHH